MTFTASEPPLKKKKQSFSKLFVILRKWVLGVIKLNESIFYIKTYEISLSIMKITKQHEGEKEWPESIFVMVSRLDAATLIFFL